jgi:hypothetical protein
MKKLDARGKYLLDSYGTRGRIRTIPFRKPARISNYQETDSQNTPRKLLLAARSSGKASPKNKPGDASNLGIYRKRSEGELLKLFYDHDRRIKTMSDTSEVLQKVNDLMDDGDYSSAESLLNQEIAKVASEIKKAKQQPTYPQSDDNGLTGSGQDNTRGHQRRVNPSYSPKIA